MKPLTLEENLFALDTMIGQNRIELAKLKFQLQLHGEILVSPADTIANLQKAVDQTAKAINWLEKQRGEITSYHAAPDTK